jgi:hypothetical protein
MSFCFPFRLYIHHVRSDGKGIENAARKTGQGIKRQSKVHEVVRYTLSITFQYPRQPSGSGGADFATGS